MRFMMVVKATIDSEAGITPSPELVDAMMKYNEELVRAGVLLAADGLHPSSGAARISYPVPGGKPVIKDGPFAETKEIIAGYTLIEVKSREEAIEWALRMPDPHGFGEGEIELRQVFDMSDLTEDTNFIERESLLRQKMEQDKRL